MNRSKAFLSLGAGARRLLLRLSLAPGVWAIIACLWCGWGVGISAAEPLTFERDVSPMLAVHCGKCHGAMRRESSFDVRRRFSIVRGGDGGAAMVPGKPGESLLLQLVEQGEMPPDGETPLGPAQVSLLKRWIAAGAPTAAAAEPPLENDGVDDEPGEEAREHWSFQPVRRIDPPQVRDASHEWVRNPIDAFVLAQLEQHGWQPAEPATRGELIRRLYFDLIGLPPTPADVEAFERDRSPLAYERLVDRLLGSPHFGERQAQPWLDVVRFAESEGFEYDRHLPDGWRYRDYVVGAFNRDLPYDDFVKQQIAGDELAPDDDGVRTATIFHRLGAVRRNAGNPDIALSRNEVLTERTNIIGEAFLGLTVGCARCHNHKLEPITQRDYYRLQAYLAATKEHNLSLAGEQAAEQWKSETARIEKLIKLKKEELAKADDVSRTASLEREIDQLTAQLPSHPPTVPGIENDFANRTAIHVLRRGVWESKGVAVGPRPLSVLVPADLPELPADMERPRTQLAAWITAAEHPLTARVIVNRLWQHHFGRGLVSTPNDFGTRGAEPTHPALLDWLAEELIRNGWRLKPIHRLILLSSVYRQSSHQPRSPQAIDLDPENRLLWRFPRRRLTAEEVRDAMLAIAGRSDRRIGGPSVMVPVDTELVDLLYKPSQWQVSKQVADHHRRSVYLIAKRNLRLPFMEAFDAPALQASCPTRAASTHASQALEMLNGALANEMAEALADRLHRDADGDPERMVRLAFQLATGQLPTPKQLALSLAFLEQQPLREFALAVLNLNEFVYVR
ncbi:MAG: PSD1 domain-containing protein [Planctomycetales bacterium]|nr:PSD1 domain-containing protein [Planctomycetales bacterium]